MRYLTNYTYIIYYKPEKICISMDTFLDLYIYINLTGLLLQ